MSICYLYNNFSKEKKYGRREYAPENLEKFLEKKKDKQRDIDPSDIKTS